MSLLDVDQPPKKKRRFFADESPELERHADSILSPPHDSDALPTSPNTTPEDTVVEAQQHRSSQTDISTHYENAAPAHDGPLGFNKETFEIFVGDKVSHVMLKKLQEVSGDNMERAINMYLDGSWKSVPILSRPASESILEAFKPRLPERSAQTPKTDVEGPRKTPDRPKALERMPEHRYVGAFGVGAWATRSGIALVNIGEAVKIERTKIKPPAKIRRGGKPIQAPKMGAARMRTDVVVRFTNARGEEIGRLPKETASWVSTLIDQQVCHFDGACFLAPERIRVNDTIELQLRCSLLKRAFEAGNFVKPEDNNRTTGIFEEKETSEEKDLRLRQVALVKLFDEINLHPSTINDTTAKHKRQGILQGAEIAEQYDKDNDNKRPKATHDDGSTPPEEEEEDGKELEQDQLDSLYKKAQSFDFDTPARDPADSFIMDLRKYQKQALYWMVSKEKDEKSGNKEISMHPLWEEYAWPTKDMDDQNVARVVDQSCFYVNPYSGELSLDFPVQEQHCLGGILADGKSAIPNVRSVC